MNTRYQRHSSLQPDNSRPVARDIDYAALAVNKAITEKYGRRDDLQSLVVTARERTISLQDSGRVAEGSRDDLLAAVRKAATYADLWEFLSSADK